MSASPRSDFRAAIEWQQPWLAPLRTDGMLLTLPACDWRGVLNSVARQRELANHAAQPIRFVPQSALPAQLAYESFIGASGHVPTRDNLHDFFNALIWLTYPHCKARLNELQAAELSRQQVQGGAALAPARGSLRDALTIFDENAVFIPSTNATLFAALREHQWRSVFSAHRAAYGSEWEVRCFGHALLEKLVAPYKAITAHAWLVLAPEAFFMLTEAGKNAWLDRHVAGQLNEGVRTAAFTPLPILGVPGWSADQTPEFYADAEVFRPPRRR